MTEYTDFIKDFPSRAAGVLDRFYPQALAQGREVTLLIMTASAALVPYDRLDRSRKHSARDWERFKDAASELNRALGKNFLKSPFHEGERRSWCFGKLLHAEPPEAPEPITDDIQTCQLLATIRNGLAHGNIWTKSRSQRKITALIFWSKIEKGDPNTGVRCVIGYKYVYVSPQDFHDFLTKWFTFLKHLKLPSDIVAAELDRAA